MAGFAQETATARLARLLTMVPWLVNRQGIDLQQAADDLGVSVEQLEADLNLLFLCGYGQLPDELIEADWEEGRVFVGNADTIARPLRLGVDEAVTLVVGLRALREVPGLGERDAVERALAKLEDAAGAAAAPARRVRAGGRRRRLARAAGAGAAGDRRPPPGAPALPRAGARRGDRARRRPDAGGRHGRQLVPRGVVPPRRGHPDVPDGPGRGAHRARRRRHAAGGRPRARPVRGHLPPGTRRPRRHPAAAARGHLGGRLLPRRVGGGRAGSARVGDCWCGCAPRTRRGCAGWCGGSGAGVRCSTRPRWSPRCATGRAPR